MAGWNVLEYVEALEGQIFPPLLVEVLLKSGQTYFVKKQPRIEKLSTTSMMRYRSRR